MRQLKYRDRECTFPGCGARRFTQAHHIVWWERGGATDLDNLVLVCSFHHKLVHEYGWGLKRGGTARSGGSIPTGPGTARCHAARWSNERRLCQPPFCEGLPRSELYESTRVTPLDTGRVIERTATVLADDVRRNGSPSRKLPLATMDFVNASYASAWAWSCSGGAWARACSSP